MEGEGRVEDAEQVVAASFPAYCREDAGEDFFNEGLMIFGDDFFLCQVTILESHEVLVAHLLAIFLGATCKLHCDVALSLLVFINACCFSFDERG